MFSNHSYTAKSSDQVNNLKSLAKIEPVFKSGNKKNLENKSIYALIKIKQMYISKVVGCLWKKKHITNFFFIYFEITT